MNAGAALLGAEPSPESRERPSREWTNERHAAAAARVATIEAVAPDDHWRPCGASGGACQCGLVWSLPGDHTVATVGPDEQMEGKVTTEWRRAHMAFIAAARADLPDLLAEVERLRAEVAQLHGRMDRARSMLRGEP